jgi:hypothetical protein
MNSLRPVKHYGSWSETHTRQWCLGLFCICVFSVSNGFGTGWSPHQAVLLIVNKIKKLKWNKAFHICPMLQRKNQELRMKQYYSVITICVKRLWITCSYASDFMWGSQWMKWDWSRSCPQLVCVWFLPIISLLTHTHISPPPKVCYSSEQPENNHILSLQVANFITRSKLAGCRAKTIYFMAQNVNFLFHIVTLSPTKYFKDLSQINFIISSTLLAYVLRCCI